MIMNWFIFLKIKLKEYCLIQNQKTVKLILSYEDIILSKLSKIVRIYKYLLKKYNDLIEKINHSNLKNYLMNIINSKIII